MVLSRFMTVAHASASVSFEAYQELLTQAAQYLPTGVRVILLADRGFVHTRAMKLMQQLGWHYRIRIKSDTWLWRPGSGWCQPKSFHLARGQALCFHNVRLHRQEKYGPVHVILGRTSINGEFWAVVSDQPTSPETFAEYGLRFDIEEGFLDDQSSGWNLQRQKFAPSLTSHGYGSSWQSQRSMSLLKDWKSFNQAADDGLTPIGFAATAIFASDWNGRRLHSSMVGS